MMELQVIQTKIFKIRGQLVMLDFDLAELYEVETRVLNQAVKRNIERFPDDFMFQISPAEWERLQLQIEVPDSDRGYSSQIVMSSRKHRGKKYLPFAFTEQGVAMLSGVLRSPKAVQVNIAVMRAFVALRRYAMTFDELAAKITSHDKELADINEVLRWLGEENQARTDEIAALQTDREKPEAWESRRRIGYKK
jgi:hypothetical protein